MFILIPIVTPPKMLKHVLGISGGKDSAALALYLRRLYPELPVTYYTSDTGEELRETYELIERLEVELGRPIEKLRAAEGTTDSPFNHLLRRKGGYLPSSGQRWCTRELKLEPFERYLADAGPVISYVGIRGDEDREGYVSTKPNIQSIFPFRQNIWCEMVTRRFLANPNMELAKSLYEAHAHDLSPARKAQALELLDMPLSLSFPQKRKLDALLTFGVKQFNRAVFAWIRTTDLPLSHAEHFPLVENEDVLKIDDIFGILRDSGVGIPAYYEPRVYEVAVDGELRRGTYSRSRSGCYFCFFQQKIEWVWLYENHPDLYEAAMAYEKDGYAWQQGETLAELCQPARRDSIKREHWLRTQRKAASYRSGLLLDSLEEAEEEGCVACFV